MNSILFIFITTFIIIHLIILTRTLKRFVVLFHENYSTVRIHSASDIAQLVEPYSTTIWRLPCTHPRGPGLPHCTCLIVDNLYSISLGRLFLRTFEKELYLTAGKIQQELIDIRLQIQGPPVPDPLEIELESTELCLILARHCLAQLFSLGQMVLCTVSGEIYRMVFFYLTERTRPSVKVSCHVPLRRQILNSQKPRRHSISH